MQKRLWASTVKIESGVDDVQDELDDDMSIEVEDENAVGFDSAEFTQEELESGHFLDGEFEAIDDNDFVNDNGEMQAILDESKKDAKETDEIKF